MDLIHTNFYKVPGKIYSLKLTAGEFIVLNYLFSLSNNEFIYPSKKNIVSNTPLTKRTVDRVIKSLTEKGFIEYNQGFVRGTKRMCNQYRIRVENFAPECLNKSQKQLNRENQNKEECDEMIKESIEEYGV